MDPTTIRFMGAVGRLFQRHNVRTVRETNISARMLDWLMKSIKDARERGVPIDAMDPAEASLTLYENERFTIRLYEGQVPFQSAPVRHETMDERFKRALDQGDVIDVDGGLDAKKIRN